MSRHTGVPPAEAQDADAQGRIHLNTPSDCVLGGLSAACPGQVMASGDASAEERVRGGSPGTCVWMGALTSTFLSAVAGSRIVSLTGCCVWKSCARIKTLLNPGDDLCGADQPSAFAGRQEPLSQAVQRQLLCMWLVSASPELRDCRPRGVHLACADGENATIGNGCCDGVLDALVSILRLRHESVS